MYTHTHSLSLSHSLTHTIYIGGVWPGLRPVGQVSGAGTASWAYPYGRAAQHAALAQVL